MRNLETVLRGAGTSLDRAVMARIYLVNFAVDYTVVNDIYRSYFAEGRYPGPHHRRRDQSRARWCGGNRPDRATLRTIRQIDYIPAAMEAVLSSLSAWGFLAEPRTSTSGGRTALP